MSENIDQGYTITNRLFRTIYIMNLGSTRISLKLRLLICFLKLCVAGACRTKFAGRAFQILITRAEKKYFLASVLMMGTFDSRECSGDDELFENEKKLFTDKQGRHLRGAGWAVAPPRKKKKRKKERKKENREKKKKEKKKKEREL